MHYYLTFFSFSMLFLITLSAGEGGSRGPSDYHSSSTYHSPAYQSQRSYQQYPQQHPSHYGQQHYYHPSQRSNQSRYYGGYGYGGAPVYPYPDAESQPGMSDDSNELYHSYLKSEGQDY